MGKGQLELVRRHTTRSRAYLEVSSNEELSSRSHCEEWGGGEGGKGKGEVKGRWWVGVSEAAVAADPWACRPRAQTLTTTKARYRSRSTFCRHVVLGCSIHHGLGVCVGLDVGSREAFSSQEAATGGYLA